MSPKRVFLLMSVLVATLAVLMVAAVVVGDIWLTHQSKKLLSLRLEDRIIEEQQTALATANKEIQQYSDLEKIAKAIVPQDKDQARTIREINNIAESSGIQLKTINFQASNLGQGASLPTTSDTDKNNSTPAPPPITQAQAVAGMPGVYSLEITISPIENKPVPYRQFLSFLEGLETNRRTAQVEKITVTPQSGDSLTFLLTLNVYVKP